MEYPLIIGGEEAGKLSVERDGLYTLMEAVTALSGEVKRVWVHGEGGEGYLGVMQPWSGGMYLKRRLSKRDMVGFPDVIEYASDISEPELPLMEEQALNPAEDDEPESIPAPVNEPKPEIIPEPETLPELVNGPEPESVPEPEIAELPAEEDSLLWFLRPDGSMTAFDGRRSLVALPARLRREREGAVIRRINGRDYMIFIY